MSVCLCILLLWLSHLHKIIRKQRKKSLRLKKKPKNKPTVDFSTLFPTESVALRTARGQKRKTSPRWRHLCPAAHFMRLAFASTQPLNAASTFSAGQHLQNVPPLMFKVATPGISLHSHLFLFIFYLFISFFQPLC